MKVYGCSGRWLRCLPFDFHRRKTKISSEILSKHVQIIHTLGVSSIWVESGHEPVETCSNRLRFGCPGQKRTSDMKPENPVRAVDWTSMKNTQL
eukprot:1392990-Amorphochlora_amoeboformis.AAC.2